MAPLVRYEAVCDRLADDLSVPYELGDDGRVEPPGIGNGLVVAGRGRLAVESRDRKDPAVALHRQQHGEALRLGVTDHGRGFPIAGPRVVSPEHAAHIAGVDLDDRRRWRAIAMCGQPFDAASPAPGGVDHEIGGNLLTLVDLDTDHPLRLVVEHQPPDVDAATDLNVGECRYPGPDRRLQQRPRHGRTDQPRRRPALGSPGLVPQEVAAQVELDRARSVELRREARKPPVKEPRAGGEQQVRVPTLRYQPPGRGVVGEDVPVEDDNAGEAISEYARGAETGHAGPDHHRLFAGCCGAIACSHQCSFIVGPGVMGAVSQDGPT